jgi:hypothetical protein
MMTPNTVTPSPNGREPLSDYAEYLARYYNQLINHELTPPSMEELERFLRGLNSREPDRPTEEPSSPHGTL